MHLKTLITKLKMFIFGVRSSNTNVTHVVYKDHQLASCQKLVGRKPLRASSYRLVCVNDFLRRLAIEEVVLDKF